MKTLKIVSIMGVSLLLVGSTTALAKDKPAPKQASTLLDVCKKECPEAKDEGGVLKCISSLEQGVSSVQFKQTECSKTYDKTYAKATTGTPKVNPAPAATTANPAGTAAGTGTGSTATPAKK